MKKIALIAAAAIFILSGNKSESQVLGGIWTQCVVHLTTGTQIAVVYASDLASCTSAGKKCARGRAWSNIIWHGIPVLAASNPVESCDAPR